MKIVLDTNVLYSALKSNLGASFKLLGLVGSNKFDICLSVPLVLEYEDVFKRKPINGLTTSDIDDVLNYLCKIGLKRDIFYLWRPHLKDAKDDMILELAFECGASYIVTYNLSDFKGSDLLGVTPIKPKDFLQIIGEL